jgi:hypothetical protein
MMIGARSIFMEPDKAVLALECPESAEGKVANYIILKGLVKQTSSTKYIDGCITVYKVEEEYKYKEVCSPSELDKEKKGLSYGQVTLLPPDEDDEFGEDFIDSEGEEFFQGGFIDGHLYLRPKEFKLFKDIVDKSFFSSKANMLINLSVFGMKLGSDPGMDEFPPEEPLTIIGYQFTSSSRVG